MVDATPTMTSESRFIAELAQLGDSDRPLVHAELKILSTLGGEVLRLFWQAWCSYPVERRVEIVQALNSLSEDNLDLDFHPVLRACLSDSDAEVRVAAIAGLWEDESERTLDRLLALLEDDSGGVRAAAAVALAPFAYRAELDELDARAGQRLLTVLLRVSGDPEQPLEVRRRAVEALGYFAASREAQAEVGRAYAHPERAMRESAILAMGRSMRPTWFPYIERELQSPAPALRYEAARAVGELAEEGRPLLVALLPLIDDDDTEVALAAIWALGQVGGPNAKRILERLARSNDSTRRQAASDALDELSLEDVDPRRY
jgi:HEAT repeat protein